MELLLRRAGRGFGFARLSQYGWARKTLLVVAALLGSAAFAAGANLASRYVLWQVVRACMLDKATTGAPLPCLEVETSDGDARGWVVLRPPIGAPDTILVPTRRIAGIEDHLLYAPNVPNYFALAWAARHWLAKSDGGAPADDRVALAVNSRLARSQDQLHVHVGCLTQRFSRHLDEHALGPASAEWVRGRDIAPGLEFWSYRSGVKDWAQLEPFHLARALVEDEKTLARVTLAAALFHGEIVVFALKSRPSGWYASADDVIDAKCG
jgi:CDP-diacylglycerol pyrophosphatase